jgi:hypothetical protein
MRLVARRDLQRRRIDLDEVAPANQPRSAAWMRLRASRNGRRSAWTSGVHQGEGFRLVLGSPETGFSSGLPAARLERFAVL